MKDQDKAKSFDERLSVLIAAQELKNTREPKSYSEEMEVLTAIAGIRELLTSLGLKNFDRNLKNLDQVDFESVLSSALDEGLSSLLGDRCLGDVEELKLILANLFIGAGHKPKEFKENLNQAMELIRPFMVVNDIEINIKDKTKICS